MKPPVDHTGYVVQTLLNIFSLPQQFLHAGLEKNGFAHDILDTCSAPYQELSSMQFIDPNIGNEQQQQINQAALPSVMFGLPTATIVQKLVAILVLLKIIWQLMLPPLRNFVRTT